MILVIVVSFILVLQRNHLTLNISQPKAKSIKSSICIDDDRKNCLAPFKKFDSKYRISRKYKLLTCVIEKNMSTTLAAIICFLYDEEAFQQANRSIANDLYGRRFCKNKNEYFTAKQIVRDTKISLGDWTMFTVARDPIDRFLSGYVNKCIL
uniref:Uncharacterized protein n=1 Tax=Acrobeloides nanus TaxID=290746 RepID=A0A914C4Q8_9BILA